LFCEEQKRKIPMLEKHLTAKIAELKSDLQETKAKNRQLRQRNKELIESRAEWKEKYKHVQDLLRGLRSGSRIVHEVSESSVIEGHKYDLKTVSLCVSLYIFGCCSFRGVKRVLMCLQIEYSLFLGRDLPSKSSIENWVQKIGLYEYTNCSSTLYNGDYSIVIDESIVIGQQRMMLILGLDAIKIGEQASCLGDVRLLYLAVRASWAATDIADLLQKVVEKMGTKPLYIVSDGNSNLIRGIKDAGLERVCDVGHEIAKLVEQTYGKEEAFKAFTTAVSGVKFREVLKDTAYLLPPKQRTIARFMNLSSIVDWATKMLGVLPKLTSTEKQTFDFLQEHQDMIVELGHVFKMTHLILKIIKNKGLSYKNIEECLILMYPYADKIPIKLTVKLNTYFKLEKGKLPDATTIWYASSDVIESLFGQYKHRASPNKLHGVTPFVLSLCLYTHFREQDEPIHDKIKKALQEVSMADLDTWKHKYLIDNQVVRRNKILKK
jgi:hypothetical protein